jgi:hypothetical protein
VRFKDEKDPKTVEAVDPANLAASFGDGVRLKRVTIETTTDPVTTGIERRLPKYGPGSGFGDWFRSLKIDDPRRVGPEDFKRG